ncbi:MAG: RNA-binding protein [Candidatus Bathyarchaeia archaeon]
MSNTEVKSTIVLVGEKLVMKYVVACLAFFNKKVATVTLKARWKAIGKAVATVELIPRVFPRDLIMGNISTGSATFEMDGKHSKPSAIETSIRNS